MNNLTTPEEIKALMESSKNETDWNSNCDLVKKANGGYPDFWFSTIIISGVCARVQESWKQPA